MSPPSIPQDNKIPEFADIHQLQMQAEKIRNLLLDQISNFEIVDTDNQKDFLHEKRISVSQISSSEMVIKFDEPMFLKRVTIGDKTVKYIKIISRGSKPLETEVLQGDSFFELNTIADGVIVPRSKTLLLYGKPLSFFTDKSLFGDFISVLKESEDKAIQYIASISSSYNSAQKQVKESELYLEALRDEAESLESEKKAISEDIKSANKHLKDIKTLVEGKSSELESLSAENNLLTNDFTKLSDKNTQLESSIKINNEKLISSSNEIKNKQDELTILKKELSNLENNKDIISLDTEGFNKASRGVLNKYYMAVAVIFSVFIGLACFMFINAFDYIDINQSYNRVSAFELFISRLPMATATIVLLSGFSALVIILTKNIIQINRERINILKASIMARQIGDSLPADICREEREALVTSTKLDLIMRLLQDNTNQNSTSSADQVIEILKATQSNNQ